MGREVVYRRWPKRSVLEPIGDGRGRETFELVRYDLDEITEVLKQSGYSVVDARRVQRFYGYCDFPLDGFGRDDPVRVGEMAEHSARSARQCCAAALMPSISTKDLGASPYPYAHRVLASQLVIRETPEEVAKWTPPANLEEKQDR